MTRDPDPKETPMPHLAALGLTLAPAVYQPSHGTPRCCVTPGCGRPIPHAPADVDVCVLCDALDLGDPATVPEDPGFCGECDAPIDPHTGDCDCTTCPSCHEPVPACSCDPDDEWDPDSVIPFRVVRDVTSRYI